MIKGINNINLAYLKSNGASFEMTKSDCNRRLILFQNLFKN